MANSAARSAIDVGTVIAGTYTIEALIGRGGMGAVFLASHARLPGKQVAIKVLHADLTEDDVLARFKREAEIASRLGHPNIVGVHDFNALPDGTPYLVLEYLEGENLAQRIKRGPMAKGEVVTIVRQIGSALAAAHREGIVHRDLKPQNVFLVPTEVGGTMVEQVKVLDFGISKIRGSTTVKTQDSAMLGTPQYMAPEQALGKHDAVDDRTDVFALGSMIYEMVCGQPAFTGASVPEVVFRVVYEEPLPLVERAPGVEPAFAAAVHRALAKKQDDRFSTVAELVAALTGEQISVNRPPRRAPSSIPPGDPKVTSEDALANTVGSGDHGEPPIAIAETQASGDHGHGRPTLRTGAGTPAVTPTVRTGGASVGAPAPASGRRGVIAALALLLAVGGVSFAISVAIRRDAAPAATSADAAVVAVVTVDAAPVVLVAVTPDAAAVVVAKVDARIATRPPKKADAAAEPEEPDVPDEDPLDPNKRTARQLYDEGRRVLAKNPFRAAELGRRLVDTYNQPRGWVLRGAAACQEHKHSELNVARSALKGRPKLLGELYSLCRNNLPQPRE